MVGLTLFTWVFCLVCHFRGLAKPYSWPYYVSHQTVTEPHGDRFGDFLVFAEQMGKLHTDHFFTGKAIFNYPPAAAIFFRLVTWPYGHKAVPYVLAMLVVVVFAGRFMVRKFKALGVPGREALGFVAGSLLFSFPLHFECLRANLEFIIVCFTAFGTWMIWRKRYTPAAVLFGVAASMKLFPFILFGIFLPLKRYKEFGLAWLVFGLMTFAGLCLETPSPMASLHGTVVGFAAFSNLAVTGISEYVGYDHGILALIKVVCQGSSVDFVRLGSRYLVVAGLVAGIVYFVRIWRLPLLNQLLALMLCMVLLPPFSADYTLLHLCAPLALLMLGLTGGTVRLPVKVLWAEMICVGVMFALKSFVILGGRMYAAQVNTVFMLALLGLVLWVPVEMVRMEETARG